MIPIEHALRASLALKLWSIERKSHVMALVAEQGLPLFCGLNAMPKNSFLAEYSSRITPRKVEHLLASWHGLFTGETILAGQSFNLDFHSVPYFGDHPIVESHAGRRVFSLSWPSTLTARSSATQTPISARVRRRRRSSASSNSGPASTVLRHSIWSSTPSSAPMSGSTRRESLSLRYAAVRQH